MKIVLIGFTIFVIVFSCGLAIRYNQNAGHARHELDGERYKRMVLEENLQAADQKILTLNADLKHAQSKIESITVALENTREMNVDLKNRLDRASKAQLSLDRQISELQQLASPL